MKDKDLFPEVQEPEEVSLEDEEDEEDPTGDREIFPSGEVLTAAALGEMLEQHRSTQESSPRANTSLKKEIPEWFQKASGNI